MGFVIMVVTGMYLAFSVFAVTWAIGHAKKNDLSVKKWGWAAALVMYLIPFWDWLPTVVVHQYYCAKDSGFWVYKTLDQWKAENPMVMETLAEDRNGSFTRVGDEENHIDKNILNPKFQWTNEKQAITSVLPVYRWKFEVIDSNSGYVLARQVDFSSGKGRDYLKFWMNDESCDGSHRDSIKASEFTNQFKGAK